MISLVLVYGYFCPIVRSPIVKSFLWESDLSIEKVTSFEGEVTSLQTSFYEAKEIHLIVRRWLLNFLMEWSDFR